jgi:hypothetical protein
MTLIEKIQVWRMKRKIAQSLKEALIPFKAIVNEEVTRNLIVKAIETHLKFQKSSQVIHNYQQVFDKETGELKISFYLKGNSNDI